MADEAAMVIAAVYDAVGGDIGGEIKALPITTRLWLLH